MSETDTQQTRSDGVEAGAPGTPRSGIGRTIADQDRFLRAYAAGQGGGDPAIAQERLSPLVKRRIFHIPSGSQVGVGWAQLPRLGGSLIALGIFTDEDHFSQVALADWHGRVFLAPPVVTQAAGLKVDLAFLPERTGAAPEDGSAAPSGPDGPSDDDAVRDPARMGKPGGDDGGAPARHAAPGFVSRLARGARRTMRRAAHNLGQGLLYAGARDDGRIRPVGMASNPLAGPVRPVPPDAVVHGAIVSGLDTAEGDPRWVASWVQEGGRYGLREMKMPLPAGLRSGLSYRDAVAVGFFAAAYLPLVAGHPQGYGSGAVFRLLREQAPMAAIRNTIASITDDALAGYRISGLDRFFLALPDQLDFLSGSIAPLLPRHGLEPLVLTTSAYSHAFLLRTREDTMAGPGQQGVGLDMAGEFEALRLESAFNRFSLVSAILESDALTGTGPVEEEADEAEVARLDRAILRDPVLTALPVPGSVLWRGQESAFDDEGSRVSPGARPDVPSYLLGAQDYARATTDRLLQDEKEAGRPSTVAGEWAYRQSLARLYETLRLPMRPSVDFRSHLDEGRVAVEMGAIEADMLPDKFFAGTGYVPSTKKDRQTLASRESLEEGLLLVTLAFGASPRVGSVTLLINDNRLSAAVHRRTSLAMGLLDSLGLLRHSSGKGEAKDRDRHGDPETTPMVPDGDPFTGSPLDNAVGDELEEPSVTQDSGVYPAKTGGDTHVTGDAAVQQDSADRGTGPRGAADEDSASDAPSAPGSDDRDGVDGISGDDGGSAAGAASDESSAGDVRPQGGHFVASAGVLPEGDIATDDEPPEPVRLVTVTFTRDGFDKALAEMADGGETDLIGLYRRFGAVMCTDGDGSLRPAPSRVSLRDLDYTPAAAQEEPEAAQRLFDDRARRTLAAKDSMGLSIQREEVLQCAVDYVTQLHRQERSGQITSVQAAQKATSFLDKVADPELETKREPLIRSLIDRSEAPDITFEDEKVLRDARHDLLGYAMRGEDPAQAVDRYEDVLARYDARYGSGPGVPRFFNSYAERVVYNHLFATPGERTLVIPDDLFYGHLFLADAYSNGSEHQAALRHLNKAVSYAPSYAMVHLRQSVQYAHADDWVSARAACLNALNVAVDRFDAGYAYYRLAYAEWQLDRFAPAAACYQTALRLGMTANGALPGELSELSERMRLQGLAVPEDEDDIDGALRSDSLVIWPDRQIRTILSEATRVSVDEGMFIPARTIARAWARVDHADQGGIDMVQARFLHSLEA